jgi:hypothetical protein
VNEFVVADGMLSGLVVQMGLHGIDVAVPEVVANSTLWPFQF